MGMREVILSFVAFISSFFATQRPVIQLYQAPPIKPTVTLVATGDVIPARLVNFKVAEIGDYSYPWLKMGDFLKKADLTVINLEAPLFSGCPVITTGFKFCGSDKHIAGLLFAGVDVASLANNHLGNYGQDGIDKTVRLLTENNIATGGAIVVKNTRFYFLSYNDIGARLDNFESEIAEAKRKNDVVVVSVHWGTEYQDEPDKRQKDLAYRMVDAGADLILGNHPHWVQPAETYKGKLIKYAHGNFIFDQNWSKKTMEGEVGKYTFRDGKLIDAQFLPIQISPNFQPDFTQPPN